MFVHGGGWSAGSKDRYGLLGEAFASRGVACAVINTQLNPFGTPRAMVGDCAAALGWLHAHAAEHGFDGEQLFVMGHSSGAHLVSWLALDGARLDAVGVPRQALRGVIGLSGVYDVRPGNIVLDRIFPADTTERADASPVVHVGEHEPPFLVIWAENEMPGLELSARVLVRALVANGNQAQGVVLPRRDHVDYVFGLGRAGDEVLPKVLQFVTQRRAGAMPPAVVLTRHPVTEALDAELGTNGPRVDLWSPERAHRLLVLAAAGAAERASCAVLAKALAVHGVAVVVAPVGEVAALRYPESPRAFAATVQRVLAHRRETQRPDLLPHLGGLAAGSWVASLTHLPVGGRILFGAPVGPGSLAAMLPQTITSPDLRDASRAFSPNGAPLLLMTGADDPAPLRTETEILAMQMLAPGARSLGLVLRGTTSGAALSQAGKTNDPVVPLVLAFLGL